MSSVPKRIIEQNRGIEVVDIDADPDSSEPEIDNLDGEEIALNQKLMRKYFASGMNRAEVPMPTFARITKNTLFFLERRIT